MVMGAGAVLDMNFPSNIIKPTTWNITEEVRKPYDDIFCANREITIVEDIYQILVRSFPVDHNIWWATNSTVNIHFEILFHVMEQLIAYQSVWASNNHNPYTFPHFAPFTTQNFSFDPKDLNQVMWKFIMRIMEIVNAYNEYFRNDNGAENWYRDFFKSDFKWDDNKIRGYKTELKKYLQTLSKGAIEFLELMSGCTCIGQMMNDFIDPDIFHPKYSINGNLMLITNGMKGASNIRNEIYSSLKS